MVLAGWWTEIFISHFLLVMLLFHVMPLYLWLWVSVILKSFKIMNAKKSSIFLLSTKISLKCVFIVICSIYFFHDFLSVVILHLRYLFRIWNAYPNWKFILNYIENLTVIMFFLWQTNFKGLEFNRFCIFQFFLMLTKKTENCYLEIQD